MGNELNLGIGISFDSSTLKSLNEMLEYVKKIQKQFDSAGDAMKKPKQAVTDLNKEVEKLNTSAKNVVKEVENVGKSITTTYGNGHGKVAQVTRDMEGQVSKIRLVDSGFKSLGDSIVSNTGKMLQWAASGTLIYGTLRLLQDGYKTMIDLETSAVNIAKVLPNPSKMSVGQLVKPFEEADITLAKKYGQSVIDVEGATANWAKQYKTVGEVAIATQASLLAATATDITFEGSVKNLSSIIAEWGLQAKDSVHIVDILNEESNNYRVTAEGLADSLTKSGSAAKSLGLSMEQLAGLSTVGIQTLGIEGNQMGTILTRVFARIRGNATAVKAISKLGIDAMQPLSTLMDELSAKWDTMSDGEKQNLALTIAGTQHWSRFIGIMDNYNTVIEATAKAYNSMDSAQQEVDNVMSTTAKHVEQLNAQWQEYIYRNSGVLNITKGIVDMLRNIVAGLSAVPAPITAVVVGLGVLTVAIVAIGTAAAWSLPAIGAMIAAFALSPLGLAIEILGGLALAFGLIGMNANRAQEQILKAQEAMSKFNTLNDGIINKSRGIIDLASKYEIYQKAIEKAKNAGQDYSKLTESFKTAQSGLSSALGISNEALEVMIAKDGGIRNFMNNRLEENAKLINSERDKANEIKKSSVAMLGQQLGPLETELKKWQKTVDANKRVFNSTDLKTNWNTDAGGIGTKLANDAVTSLQAQIKAIKDQMANIKLDTHITTVDELKNAGTGGGGLGKPRTGEGPEDKVQKIIDTYNNEMIAIKNQVDAYKRLGIEYDSIKAKITATTTAMEAMSKIAPNNDWLDTWAKSLAVLKPEEIFAKINTGMGVAETQFQATGDVTGYFTDQIKLLSEALKDLKSIDPTNPKLAELQQQLNDISQHSALYKDMQKSVEMQAKSSRQAAGKLNKFDDKQAFAISNTLDALSTSLANLGTSAGNTLSVLSKAMSDNFTAENGMNWDKAGSQAASGFWQEGVSSIISGLGGLLSGTKTSQFNKNAESGYSVGEISKDFQDYDKNLKKYKDLMSQLNAGKVVTGVLEVVGTAIGSIWGPVGAAIGGALGKMLGDMFSHTESLSEKIEKLSGKLQATWGKLKEALGTSVEDIANALGSSFQATNYSDFLTNWSKGLYDITRQSLIKAFMASEAFQGLYKSLSDTVTVAIMDGYLTADELTAISAAGDQVAQNMKVLYQALGALDQSALGSGGTNSGSGTASYTAGSSTPVNYQNYISIYGTYFGEDPDGLREFALLIAKTINEENSRA